MTAFQRERVALGQRLRVIRQDAGLTGRALARVCGWQPSKISKIEAGRQAPSDTDLRAWAAACSAESEVPGLLVALRTLDSHYVEDRREFRAGRTPLQRRIGAQEAATTELRWFESAFVPGLLQTADYARSMLSDYPHPGADDDLEQAIGARMARQQVLRRTGKSFHFVVTEAVLRYRMCPPGVLLRQLEQLVEAAGRPAVRFGVIPFLARYRVATPVHGFTLHDDSLVRVETVTAQLTIEEPAEIRVYREMFEDLARVAVYGADARAVIERARSDLASTVDDDSRPSTSEATCGNRVPGGPEPT